MMRRTLLLLVALGVLAAPRAQGQKATERFIPIGKSPGLSGKRTYMGKIGTVDADGRTIGGKTWSATVTDRTRIWLDRTKLGLSNTKGTVKDLKPGAVIEVKYEGREKKTSGPAEWIKIEVPAAAK
ncbi:MAG: hypothetical protein ACHQ1G_13770 [Planctomycetota bacterium]